MLERLLLRLIGAYQYVLSPWIGNGCRYWPTCSEYAREAIELHGAGRGAYLAAVVSVAATPMAEAASTRCQTHSPGAAAVTTATAREPPQRRPNEARRLAARRFDAGSFQQLAADTSRHGH